MINTTNRFLAVMLIALLFIACDTQHHHEGAHVHGIGVVDIAVENDREFGLVFRIPAINVYGFGYEPTSPEDIQTRDTALTLLRENSDQFVQVPAGCQLSDSNVSVQRMDADHQQEHADEHSDHSEDHAEGGHSEVEGTYTYQCAESIEDARLQLKFGQVFPDVKKLEVRILGARQDRTTIEDPTGDVEL